MFGRSHSDKKLVKRMLRGDEAAFNQFFNDYFPRIYRFALTRLGNDPQLAEEITQATLCAVIDKLESYRGEAALFTWACTFCRYEISHWRRKNQRYEKDLSITEDAPEIRAALESLSGENQLDFMERKEVARLVQVTLDHLSPKYAQVLSWKYIEGWSVKRIAEQLELGPKAAESLLTRAREAFKDAFKSFESHLGGVQS